MQVAIAIHQRWGIAPGEFAASIFQCLCGQVGIEMSKHLT